MESDVSTSVLSKDAESFKRKKKSRRAKPTDEQAMRMLRQPDVIELFLKLYFRHPDLYVTENANYNKRFNRYRIFDEIAKVIVDYCVIRYRCRSFPISTMVISSKWNILQSSFKAARNYLLKYNRQPEQSYYNLLDLYHRKRDEGDLASMPTAVQQLGPPSVIDDFLKSYDEGQLIMNLPPPPELLPDLPSRKSQPRPAHKVQKSSTSQSSTNPSVPVQCAPDPNLPSSSFQSLKSTLSPPVSLSSPPSVVSASTNLFANYISVTLDSFSPAVRAKATKLMSDVIFYAQTGDISNTQIIQTTSDS